MKVGDRIKWTANDRTYLGVVMAVTDKHVKVRTPEEIKEFPLDYDKFEIVEETLTVDAESSPETKKDRAERLKRPSTAGTKTEAALVVYKSMPDATRQEIIKAFQEKVGLSAAGAATYYTNCKKTVEKES
jgi:hypothetical protein